MIFEFTNNALLHSLVTTGYTYSNTPPWFTIFFQNNIQFDRNQVELFAANHLSNWQSIVHLIAKRTPGDERNHHYINVETSSKLREIVDHLYRNGFISVPDRASIENLIRDTETIIQNRASISPSLSDNQRDIIHLMVSPYLESIAEPDFSLTLCIKLFSISLLEHVWESGDHIGLWGHVIRVKKINDDVKSQVPEDSSRMELYGCLTAMSLIYNGHGNLESTFARQGAGIPPLNFQKSAILMLITNQIMAKFSIENNLVKFFIYFTLKNGSTSALPDLSLSQLTDGIRKFFINIDVNAVNSEYAKNKIIEDLYSTIVELDTNANELNLNQALTNRQASLLLACFSQRETRDEAKQIEGRQQSYSDSSVPSSGHSADRNILLPRPADATPASAVPPASNKDESSQPDEKVNNPLHFGLPSP